MNAISVLSEGQCVYFGINDKEAGKTYDFDAMSLRTIIEGLSWVIGSFNDRNYFNLAWAKTFSIVRLIPGDGVDFTMFICKVEIEGLVYLLFKVTGSRGKLLSHWHS